MVLLEEALAVMKLQARIEMVARMIVAMRSS